MYVPPPHMSLAEKLARSKMLRERDKEFRDSVALPLPAVWQPEDWPLHARVWLYKAGLSDADIVERGVYYHAYMDRVVLPVLNEADDTVVYWQARGFDEHTPKYINPRVDRGRIVYYGGSKVQQGGTVVLTEDILSAIKVGKVAPAWSLLGTDLKDEVLAQLLTRDLSVIVWLDNDSGPVNPGQDAARAIIHRLKVFGIPYANIVSRADPKLLRLGEIEEHLANAEILDAP